MSAQWRDDEASPGRLQTMTTAQLDAVMAIEVAAYAFPWSRGNFIDSLASGYPAQVLLDAQGAMLGYFVAMGGVDEMHLLNITVAPAVQGRGHARRMIDALIALCREQRAHELWLEVRESNARARSIYTRLGFEQKGLRKGYYPAPFGRREDAVVMSLALGASDALD
jgi:ribosomal-protein-alanine N-acetyltransferase